LGGDSNGGEGRDDGVLALEGVGEGFEGVIVDWNGGDRGREAMRAGPASEDGNFEACIGELVEDSWAEVASGLRGAGVSLWKDLAEGTRG
jgi:hypothetical protein